MQNAIYTPSPETVAVIVWEDDEGNVKADTDHQQDHLIKAIHGGTILRRENAKVVVRGNLSKSGTARWHTVELADGSRHSVLTEGS